MHVFHLCLRRGILQYHVLPSRGNLQRGFLHYPWRGVLCLCVYRFLGGVHRGLPAKRKPVQLKRSSSEMQLERTVAGPDGLHIATILLGRRLPG